MSDDTAQQHVSADDRQPVLEAFTRGLRREAHVLSRRPELLWQQLYNRLQWEGVPLSPLLQRELARRETRNSTAFLRISTRSPESDSLVRRLVGHEDYAGRPKSAAVKACAFNAAGSRIVSAAQQDPHLRLWDVTSGRPVGIATSAHGWFASCVFSKSDSFIVAGHSDGTIQIWDGQLGQLLASWMAHDHAEVTSCDILGNDSLIVSAGGSVLKLWNFGTDGVLRGVFAHPATVTCCRISPDGAVVVSGSADGMLTFWDANEGGRRGAVVAHEKPLLSCAWSYDGQRVATAGQDGAIKIWREDGSACLLTISCSASGIAGCTVSPDNEYVVSAGLDGLVKLWDLNEGRELVTLAGAAAEVWCCAVSRDGSLVASGDSNGELQLWQLEQ